MMLYPVIVCIFALLAILFLTRKRFANKSIMFYIFWILLWLFIVVFAFVPELSSVIGNFFGISRGMDFLLVVAVIVSFYLIFRLFIKIDDLQEEITELVRLIAIKDEIIAKKEDELNNKK